MTSARFDPDGGARIEIGVPPQIAPLTDGASVRRDDIVKGVKARLKMIHDCVNSPMTHRGASCARFWLWTRRS